jgi:hypothetical protein
LTKIIADYINIWIEILKKTDKKVIWLPADDNLLIEIELRKYIIPISDTAYTSEFVKTDKSIQLLRKGTYIQVLKGKYYKKMNDQTDNLHNEIFVEVSDGKKT